MNWSIIRSCEYGHYYLAFKEKNRKFYERVGTCAYCRGVFTVCPGLMDLEWWSWVLLWKRIGDEKKRGCICMLNRVTINSTHDPTMILFYRALYFGYLHQIIILQLFCHTFIAAINELRKKYVRYWTKCVWYYWNLRYYRFLVVYLNYYKRFVYFT
jgi:hypothetical protein